MKKSKTPMVMSITGGGATILKNFFEVSGVSEFLLEATVPYHPKSLSKFLRSEETYPCDSRTARGMAMEAFRRAKEITGSEAVLGVGCTAALQTTRKRRGKDRCHVCVQSKNSSRVLDMDLDQSLTRAQQEKMCIELIFVAIAKTLSLRAGYETLKFKETLVDAPSLWKDLLAGTKKKTSDKKYEAIFPGSFAPLHRGHKEIILLAEKKLNARPALEISIKNVDKPPLDFVSMKERNVPDYEIVFTNAATFEEKAELFPGSTFIVGVDTLARIDQARYYNGKRNKSRILEKFRKQKIRFLVFGRQVSGQFLTLSSIQISPALLALCDEVSESEFRVDMSSSAIRASEKD
ncbi:MAG: hypothetical protein VXX78_01475 [Pseudomonadota bacterium]|nr:hypothetical protein [Pseudomonadota bacterium]